MSKLLILSLLLLGSLAYVGGFVLAKAGRADTPMVEGQALPTGKLSAMTAPVVSDGLLADAEKIAAMEDGEALLEILRSFGDDTRGQIGRQLVFERWAQIDPEGAFAALRGDWREAAAFLIEWAVIDPAAMSSLMIEEKITRNYSILPQLALRAPGQYLELIAIWNRELPPEEWYGSKPMRMAFSKVYADDPDKALALLADLPRQQKVDASMGIAKAMAEVDVSAARAWAEGLEDRKQRDAAIGTVAMILAKRDPDAAVPLLMTLKDPVDRASRFETAAGGILMQMVRDDPAEAITWARRHFENSGQDSYLVRAAFAISLSSAGAAETVKLLDGPWDDRTRRTLIAHIYEGARFPARLDAGAILEDVDQLESADARKRARWMLVTEFARSDLQGAIRYVEGLPPEEFDAHLWNGIFQGGGGGFAAGDELFWENIGKVSVEKQGEYLRYRLLTLTSTDPDAALAKLSEYRDHSGYAEIVGGVAMALQKTDPAAARALVEDLEGEALGQAALSYIENGVGDEAEEVFEWMRTLPIGDGPMIKAANSLAWRWVTQDALAASEAIRELPPGAARDGAIIGLVRATISRDPAIALAWTDEIADPGERERLRDQAERQFRSTARLSELEQ